MTTTSGRTSLLRTAASARCVASMAATVAATIPVASAVENMWTGATSNNWNEPTNWSEGRVPVNPSPHPDGYDDAAVNSLTNFPVLTGNPVVSPRDLTIAEGAAVSGRLDQRAGILPLTGGWMFVGDAGGTGEWNIADTSTVGGGLSGFAQGSASITGAGRWYIGRGADSEGTVRINTSGAVTINSQLQVGIDTGTGTLMIESGAVNTQNWTEVGNGAGSMGTLEMTGGSLNKTGNDGVSIATNGGTGVANISGGALTSNNGIRVGVNGGSDGTLNLSGGSTVSGGNTVIGLDAGTGEMNVSGGLVDVGNETWVGQGGSAVGELNLSAGTVDSSSWVAIGRDGGTGTVNMTGGTWQQTDNGDASFIVGASGPGTFTQSGGTVDLQATRLWVGENAAATYSLGGTGVVNAPEGVEVARGGASTSALDLDGGTLNANWIRGGAGTSTVNFNGTQINATGNQANFLSGVGTATVDAGGLLVNTGGFALGASQALGGTGDVLVTGGGSLALLGAHTYTGTTTITAGQLTLSNNSANTNDVQIDDGASFGITEAVYDSQLSPANLTFDGASTLNVAFTDLGGVLPNNAPVNVTGTLTLGGDLVVNVADVDPEVGTLPLVAYAAKAGVGAPVLGNLPEGVAASLQDDGSLISLDVVYATPLYWDGDISTVWSTTAANWAEQDAPLVDLPYTDGRWVVFDDFAFGTKNVVLTTAVNPFTTMFDNPDTIDPYTLSGTGAIAGTGDLIKRNTGTATINTTNTFTGVTRVEGGVLSVSSLPNGGVASPIGASSADPANLVLAGGTLAYTGAAATTDRGFTLEAADSGISVDNALTIQGQVIGTAGNFRKLGAGDLSFTFDGLNDFGTQGQGIRIAEGDLAFTGSGSQVNAVPGELWMSYTEGTSASLLLSNTTLNVDSWIAIGRGNGTGGSATISATDSTITSANFSTGYTAAIATNDSTQTVSLDGTTTWTNGGNTYIAESAGAMATLTLADSAHYISNGTMHMGAGGSAVMNLSGSATVTANTWFTLGRYEGGSGVANITSGTLEQTSAAQNLYVGEDGSGELNVSGTGSVTVAGDHMGIGIDPTATGVVNLGTGGTITVNAVNQEGGDAGTGTGTFNFDGGTLVAAGPRADFMAVTTATVSANGGTIDTNGNDITVNQSFSGVGGLTKSGVGMLTLTAVQTSTGTTTVAEGTLTTTSASVFDNGSSVDVQAGATLNLAFTGTDAVDALTINGVSLPGGIYDSSHPSGQITGTGRISVGVIVTPFDTWVDGYFPGETDPAIIGPDADPDGDGQSNKVEFALGGDPSDGSNNAKVFTFAADSDADGDATDELLMTIAVRAGTAAFAGSPSPTATQDGYTYTVQGSTDLAAFGTGVTPVTVVPPAGAPTPPTGYEYRSFSLDGSNGLPARGFLRVDVTP